MATEIRVPEVSDGVAEGTVIGISVSVGETVDADQTLVELETDKAVVAIPAPFAGTITKILVAEGESVAIGAVIMLASATGKAETEPTVPDAQPETPPVEVPVEVAEPPAAVAQASPETVPSTRHPATQIDLTAVRSGDMVAPAAPSVRRLARDMGVDIYQVQGSGPGGRISADDIRGFVRTAMQNITGGGTVPQVTGEFPGLHAQRPLPDFSKWGPVTHEPVSRVRRITADAMGYAWSTIPMVTQNDKADITDLEAFRQAFNRKVDPQGKLTMTAILIKICVAALQAFPHVNSSLDLVRDELIIKNHFHIGVAVDTPGGLLVPVLRDADRKGIRALAVELNEVAAKTRERRISPADMEGGTFTISNLGGIGGTAFTPIVYAPQAAILGVSRAEKEPVWRDGSFEPRLRMPLALTYDHRIIDGAEGARFLRWICQAIENPINIAMEG